MAMEGVDMPRLIVRHRSHSPVRCRRSQSPVRRASPGPTRRVPSPLENAQFRPVAMNYAASPTNSQSCKYFNQHYKEEEDEPVGAPGGFCSAVRTVGYSTVGGKSFMSGKCPHCKRMVKSDNQVCTPNATPPPSPWKVKLQSPLRSPLRSPKIPGGHATLQSPLRSPFKGSFFGKDSNTGKDADSNTGKDADANTGKDADSHTGKDADSHTGKDADSNTGKDADSHTGKDADSNTGKDADSNTGKDADSHTGKDADSHTGKDADSHTGKDAESHTGKDAESHTGKDAESNTGKDSSDNPTDIGIKPAKSPLEPSPVKNRPSARSSSTRSQHPSSASLSPRGRNPETNLSLRTPWRGRALTSRSTSPVRAASRSLSPVRAAGPSTRGPRSPGPRSPMHSPWKGAGFFEGTDEVVTSECSSSSAFMAKSRGAHSPGPRSPLRVEVNFESVEEKDERREAEERSKAAQASNQHSENGWKIKSPLRSPFKGGFLSRVKNHDVAAPAESE